MRKVVEPQMEFGERSIASIELDVQSRDDIPQVLRGLQHLYADPETRAEVFSILKELVPGRKTEDDVAKVDSDNGRPGMTQWKILVLGVLRVSLNADYDRIRDLANHHQVLRLFLGHGKWEESPRYSLQTLRDNLRLFTPDVLDRINQVVVKAAHREVKPTNEAVVGRCDSFVVETNVHYPTDLNLLLDAIRKLITLSARLAETNQQQSWRQHSYHQRKFKRLYRQISRLRHSNLAGSPAADRQGQCCRRGLRAAIAHVERARATGASVMPPLRPTSG